MRVKENQPHLRADIAFWFEYEHGLRREDPPAVCLADKEHGRLVTSTLQRTAALNDYLKWPGLGQVFRITQQSTNLKTGETNTKNHYGLTSLSLTQASGSKLLHLCVSTGILRTVCIGFAMRSLPRITHAHEKALCLMFWQLYATCC